MVVRRVASGLVLCLGVALAAPGRAEDPAALTQPLDTGFIEDVAGDIGSFLGKLVAPPPPGSFAQPNASRGEALPAPVKAAVPPPVSEPAAAPPVAAPVPAVAQPAPPPVQAVVPPVSAPPRQQPAASVSRPAPAPAPAVPPPPARPAAAPVVQAAAPAAQAAVPPCAARAAATATLEQLRRLPRCSP